jgi:hypothetical protein
MRIGKGEIWGGRTEDFENFFLFLKTESEKKVL